MSLSALAKRRLTKLAQFLKTVKPSQFDMSVWKVSGCNTTACAAGWAGSIPSFRRAGLHLNEGTEIWTEPSGRHVEYTILYRDLQGLEAAEAFFDLTHSEACYLFYGDHAGFYPYDEVTRELPKETPKQMSRRIKKFIKSDGDWGKMENKSIREQLAGTR